MNKTKKYAQSHLASYIQDIEQSERINDPKELNVFEKSIILKYTDDGYEALNEGLRKSKGMNNTEFGQLLEKSLSKLSNFLGLVYRSVNLTPLELLLYRNAEKANMDIIEHTFISTSKSSLVAQAFNGNCFFKIFSKTGKSVEKIAKFGIYTSQNEQEVLFTPNSRFKVLEITDDFDYTLITMEEV